MDIFFLIGFSIICIMCFVAGVLSRSALRFGNWLCSGYANRHLEESEIFKTIDDFEFSKDGKTLRINDWGFNGDHFRAVIGIHVKNDKLGIGNMEYVITGMNIREVLDGICEWIGKFKKVTKPDNIQEL